MFHAIWEFVQSADCIMQIEDSNHKMRQIAWKIYK